MQTRLSIPRAISLRGPVKPKAKASKTPQDPQDPQDKPLEGKRIMVDPGHGGADPGARGPGGGKESMVNLGVSLRLRDKLEALGAEVRMTRESDRKVSHPGANQGQELRARVALANKWPADIFVSVHSNSASRVSARGTETYHSRNASRKSKEMAANVHKEMVKATGFIDRKVKSANFHVIKNTHMPAILVETGFMTNAVEEAELVDPDMQEKMAQAISDGVEQSFAQRSNSGTLLAGFTGLQRRLREACW